MYYDLITSLPRLPRLDSADRLPTTPLKLRDRLRLLSRDHADQLKRAYSLVPWRHSLGVRQTNQTTARTYAAFTKLPLNSALREYVQFRIEQQTLVMALRQRHAGIPLGDQDISWAIGNRSFHVRVHWDEPDFRLSAIHTWIPSASELLKAGNAIGLDRLLMDVAWKQLDRYAERNMFGFQGVFAYCFKWDILKAWLGNDPEHAAVRFRNLVGEATHAECN